MDRASPWIASVPGTARNMLPLGASEEDHRGMILQVKTEKRETGCFSIVRNRLSI